MFKLHYFNGTLNTGFVALYTGRMIQLASIGLIGLFLPVYLLIHFQMRVDYVMLWYLAGHLAYSLILPVGIRFLNVIGLRRSLRLSVILDALYLTTALFIPRDPLLFASLSAFFVVLARLFFWLPYHIDFAKMTDRSNRGKEVGVIWATHSFLGIIMPLAAGLLIGYYNFTIVFILAVALYLASAIPFLFLPRTGEKFEWGYAETFKNFFRKENRPLVLSNLANGAENAVALVIWPIFIWQILAGNYVAVGAVSSLIVLAGVQPALVELMDEIQAQIDAIIDPTEVLRNFSMKLADFCTANPEASAIIVSELLTFDADRLALAMRYVPDMYGPIRTVMTLARAQGILRPGTGLEPATDFFLSSVLNVIRTNFATGRIDKVRPMLNVTLEIFLHGAFAEKTDHQEETR